ncbi:MAG: NAD-dependent epimerase/dehydratase family protein [Planctomycetota bacterium]
MKVAISGASGMVGRALSAKLTAGGDSVVALVRREARGPAEARWDPLGNMVDTQALEGCDAVVHLAGESIAEGRWNESKKRAIHQSRAAGTETLSTALASMDKKPKVLVSASAIGFYGDRGDEVMDESSSQGSLFLSQVCRDWEDSAKAAADAGIRVLHPRIGVVLSKDLERPLRL